MNYKQPIYIFFLAVIVSAAFFSFFQPALAQYQNQEKIPGAEPTSDFIQYIKDIINFGYAVIGILALFMLIIGAYQYLIAAGTGNVAGAKETVASALLGLILGICAYIILNKINPDLVSFRAITQIQGTDFVDSSSLSSKSAFWNFLSSSSNTSSNYTAVALSYSTAARIAQYNSEIQAAHDKYPNVSIALIKAVIDQESQGVYNAVSPKGATGLMQLMDWAKIDRTNPTQNIMTGTAHLDRLLRKYNNKLDLTLAAYNAGEGNVQKYGGIPPFKETQKYVRSVIGKMASY